MTTESNKTVLASNYSQTEARLASYLADLSLGQKDLIEYEVLPPGIYGIANIEVLGNKPILSIDASLDSNPASDKLKRVIVNLLMRLDECISLACCYPIFVYEVWDNNCASKAGLTLDNMGFYQLGVVVNED